MAASTGGGSGRSASIVRRIAPARLAILWERLLLRLWRAAALLAAFLLVLAAVAVRDLRGLA